MLAQRAAGLRLISAGSTSKQSSPLIAASRRARAPSSAATVAARTSIGCDAPAATSEPGFAELTVRSSGYGAGAADLVLQLQDPVNQSLGRRRATGHVDVNRHDAVATAYDRIGIVVVAAAVGARAH